MCTCRATPYLGEARSLPSPCRGGASRVQLQASMTSLVPTLHFEGIRDCRLGHFVRRLQRVAPIIEGACTPVADGRHVGKRRTRLHLCFNAVSR